MSKCVRNKCLVFLVRLGRRGNLFADLNRVVIIGVSMRCLQVSCEFTTFKNGNISILLVYYIVTR